MTEEEPSMTNFWRAKTAQEIADIVTEAANNDEAIDVNKLYKEVLICIVSGTAVPFFTLNSSISQTARLCDIINRAVNESINPKLDAINTKIDALQEDIDAVKSSLAAIQERTDNLPDSPAADGAEMSLKDGALARDKIFDGALSAKKFDVNVFNSSNFEDNTFIASKFGDNAISSRVVSNGFLTADKLGAGVITAFALNGDAIRTIQQGLALSSDLAAGVDNLNDTLDALNAAIQAVLVKTKKIPDNPAASGDSMALIDNAINETKITSLAVNKVQSNLVSSNDLAGVIESINTLNTKVNSLAYKLDQVHFKTQNLPEIPASGQIPTAERIAEIVIKKLEEKSKEQ